MSNKNVIIDRILINAMIIHPLHGSEFGFPWQWLLCLSEYKHLQIEVISGIHEDNVEVIEAYLFENQIENLKFHFIPFPKVFKFNFGKKTFAPFLSFQTTIKYWLWYWKAYKLAKKITNDRKVDVLHQLNPIGFRVSGFLGLLKKPFVWGPIGAGEQFNLNFFSHLNTKGKLYYLSYNSVNFIQWRFFPYINYCFRRADALIASTSALKKMLENKCGVQKNDVFHIPETGAITKNLVKTYKSKQQGKLKIAVVCYFQHRKNLPFLFDAIKNLPSDKLEVKICGEGPSERYFRSYANKLELKNVEFLGWMKKNIAREVIEGAAGADSETARNHSYENRIADLLPVYMHTYEHFHNLH